MISFIVFILIGILLYKPFLKLITKWNGKEELHIMQKIAAGFTLLSIVCLGWGGWQARTMDLEGERLIENIGKAQKVYYAKHGAFYDIGATPISYCPELGIDARKNKYYKLFSGDARKDIFTLRVYGDKNTLYAQDNYFDVTADTECWKVVNYHLGKAYETTIPY